MGLRSRRRAAILAWGLALLAATSVRADEEGAWQARAETALREAHRLYEAEAYEEARERYRVAWAAFDAAGDPHGVVACALRTAECWDAEERHAESIEAWKTCCAEARDRFGTTPSELLAKLTSRLASAYERAGQLEPALGARREALGMLDELAQRASTAERNEYGRGMAQVAAAMARCLERLGRGQEAAAHYELALRILLDVLPDPHPQIVTATVDLAGCLQRLGRLEAARSYWAQALERGRQLYGEDAALLLDLIARLAECEDQLAHLEACADLWQEAVLLARSLPPEAAEARILALNGLGSARWRQGRAPEALPIFKECLEICTQHLPPTHFATARAHLNLGACLRHLGRPVDALAAVDRALALWRAASGGDNAFTALIQSNRALCLEDAGRWEDALDANDQAILLLETLGSGRAADLALAHLNRAGLLMRMGRLLEALASARRGHVLALGVYGPQHPEVAAHLGAVGTCLSLLGRTKEAISVHEAVLTSMLASDHPRTHLAAANLGEALLGAGIYEDAARALSTAITRLESLRASGTGLDVPDSGAWFASLRAGGPYHLMAMAQLGLDRPDLALGYLERGRARAMLDLLGGAGDDGAGTEPLRPEAIQALLGPRERMLVYGFSRVDGAVFLVGPPDVPIRSAVLRGGDGTSPVAPAALAGAVDDLLGAFGLDARTRGPLRRGPVAAGDAARRHGRALFEMLVPSGVWDEIRSMARIYVVADGPVHRVPFEALVPPGSDAQAPVRYWLDEGPPIAYVPSASLLAWCRARRADQRAGPRAATVVALGDPKFAQGGDLARLPGTRREVEAVAVAFADTSLEVVSLLGDEATESRLFEAAKNARYLLLATHGISDERERGSRSALYVTPTRTAGEADEGSIILPELLARWRGHLETCELVVLSACETQLGPIQRDEGVYALPLGFHRAGCPAVVGSLWSVGDDSTAELMSEFFSLLSRADAEDADTLASFTEARRKLRARHPSPRDWAPFIYLGSPR